jgi:hypothetical protein
MAKRSRSASAPGITLCDAVVAAEWPTRGPAQTVAAAARFGRLWDIYDEADEGG